MPRYCRLCGRWRRPPASRALRSCRISFTERRPGCGATAAYQSQGAVIRAQLPKAHGLTNRRTRYKGIVNEAARARNRSKSQVQSRFEPAFGVIKGMFHFTKVRYRGLEKHAHRLSVTCALGTLSSRTNACRELSGHLCQHTGSGPQKTPRDNRRRCRDTGGTCSTNGIFCYQPPPPYAYGTEPLNHTLPQ